MTPSEKTELLRLAKYWRNLGRALGTTGITPAQAFNRAADQLESKLAMIALKTAPGVKSGDSGAIADKSGY